MTQPQDKFIEEVLNEFDVIAPYKINSVDTTNYARRLRVFIADALLKQETHLRETLRERVETLRQKHVIDMELYHDSGGGEMCEVCGKQGTDLDEPCDRNNDWNAAIDKVLSLLSEPI